MMMMVMMVMTMTMMHDKTAYHDKTGARRCSICDVVLCFQLVDWRVEFSRWWVNEFKTVKFPSQGTVFDYYIDTETKKFEPWSKKVPTFELDPDVPLQATVEKY